MKVPLDQHRSINAAFAAAVERVLADSSYTHAAKEVGGRLLGLGGAGEVIGKIEELAASASNRQKSM